MPTHPHLALRPIKKEIEESRIPNRYFQDGHIWKARDSDSDVNLLYFLLIHSQKHIF